MRAADEEAFSAFVKEHFPALRRTAASLTFPDDADADDVVQAALMRLAARWGSVSNPYAYVARAVFTTAVDRVRQRARRPVSMRRADDPAVERSFGVPDETSALAARDELVRALGRLPDRQRQVLTLRYLCDLSEAQCADWLGISVGAVKNAAWVGLRRLRDLLEVTPATSTKP